MTTVNITTCLKAFKQVYKPAMNDLDVVQISNKTVSYYHGTHKAVITVKSDCIVRHDDDVSYYGLEQLTRFNVDGILADKRQLTIFENIAGYEVESVNYGMSYYQAPEVKEYPHRVTVDMKRIKEIHFCTGKNDSREMLNGVAVYIKDGDVIGYAATNAYHLIASASVDYTELSSDNCLILPRRIIDFFLKIKVDKIVISYDLSDGFKASISATAEQIHSNSDITVTVYDKVLNATYPDIRRVIDVKTNTDLTINIPMLDKASKVSVPLYRGCKDAILIDPNEKRIIANESREAKYLTIFKNAAAADNEATPVWISAGYLLNMIKSLRIKDEITLKMQANSTKSLTYERDTCQCCGGKLPYWIKYVIMPLRG